MFVVSPNRSCLKVHLESIDAKFCTFLATFILHCIAFNNDLNIKKEVYDVHSVMSPNSPASIHKGADVNREQDEQTQATAGESSLSTPYNSESTLKPSSQL